MIVNKHTTLLEFLFYLDTFNVSEDKIEVFLSDMKNYHLPEIFTPTDKNGNKGFNILKFRQLIDLQEKIKTFNDLLFVSFDVIHGLKQEDIINLSAFDCLKFALYTKSELERITKLFKAIEYKPTSEEIKAGIGKINHGFFGTIDWYARRMGISDHDQVVELNWVRIYECLKIDFDNNRFEKRYRQVVSQQQKLRK